MTYDLKFGKAKGIGCAEVVKILQVSVTWLGINTSVWLSNNAATAFFMLTRQAKELLFHTTFTRYKQVTFRSAKVTAFSKPTS